MTTAHAPKASTPDHYYALTSNAAKSEGVTLALLRAWLREAEKPALLWVPSVNIILVPHSQIALARNSASSSFYRQAPDLETFLAEQQVSPVRDLDDLAGDFWPEDESIDDFIAAIREWRSEDSAPHS